MREEIFRMERVTYMEQEVMLLEDFNIQIYRGEILGLLYSNAHGLTAFLKLLQTNLPLYDGYVYLAGEKINSWRESRKNANRISVIGTEKRLVESMSVCDNVFVLRQGFRQEIIRNEILRKQLAPFLEEIGMDISVDASIESLTVFERVVVELLRAVVMGNRLIVFNEIGMLISYEELNHLHEILRYYAKKGFSFLYICPHFEEMLELCDRVSLFSNGRIQKNIRKEEMQDNVLKLYVNEYGHMIRSRLKQQKENQTEKKEVLRFEHITGEYMKDISAQVFQGECLAVQVQDNHVFREIKQFLVGNKTPFRGEMRMNGRKEKLMGNPEIAVIQELATKSMVFPELDYMDNLCISLAERIPYIWRKHRIRASVRREYGPLLGEEVFYTPVERLSEKQKYQMVYTRILLQKPQVVFCIQPFKGADRTHRMFIWKMLNMLLDAGIAIVILSLNLSDSLALADRLLILGDRGQEEEIGKKDFGSIPISNVLPWAHLYKEQ